MYQLLPPNLCVGIIFEGVSQSILCSTSLSSNPFEFHLPIDYYF
jgi:hypothetical protein